MLNSLSGRFLILTVIFVMLAEIFIFVPSVARFREDYMQDRLERAQIASLALLAEEDIIDESLEEELLVNAGVFNVVLRRNESRQLMLASEIPSPIVATYDMRSPPARILIMDALRRLASRDDEVIRVIGNPVQDAGLLIEVTLATGPLRAEMVDYGIRVLILSAVISIFTATLLFLAVRGFLVKPIKRVVSAITSYAADPEDARRIIAPSADVRELAEAEKALQEMQTQLTSVLKQRERLAALGSAVAKISHDLRNILTTAQLFADRMESSQDPAVARMAPKLINSIGRAVSLCERTLAYGKAEEPAPTLEDVVLVDVVHDVFAGERLASEDGDVTYSEEMAPDFMIRADSEQLYRVIGNLVRNARQALVATGKPGAITVTAGDSGSEWWIKVADNGPGLPPKAQEHLFTPFQGSVRKGGSGLGLVIAAELIRGHGGTLSLAETGPEGTTFSITLPKAVSDTDRAA